MKSKVPQGPAARTSWYSVTSDSMSPALREGDTLETVPCRPEDLKRGDLVVFKRGAESICHRFLGRRSGHLYTQGDNLWHPDPPFPEDALEGKGIRLLRPGRSPTGVDGKAARLRGIARIALRRAKRRADRLLRRIFSVLCELCVFAVSRFF